MTGQMTEGKKDKKRVKKKKSKVMDDRPTD
jgi:hypothetical protein